jgi:hypothetical protein
MALKSKEIIQSRRYARSDGRYRTINISAKKWAVLDWLIDEYAYPVDELIDDVEQMYSEQEFDAAFSEGVQWAYDAQIMARDNLANDNFSEGHA